MNKYGKEITTSTMIYILKTVLHCNFANTNVPLFDIYHGTLDYIASDDTYNNKYHYWYLLVDNNKIIIHNPGPTIITTFDINYIKCYFKQTKNRVRTRKFVITITNTIGDKLTLSLLKTDTLSHILLDNITDLNSLMTSL